MENVDFFDGKVVMDTNGNVKVEGDITAKSVTTEKLNILTPEPVSSQSAETKSIGEAIIPAGQTSLTVNTTAVGINSFVFVTPKSSIDFSIAVTEQVPGESFTVQIPSTQVTDVKFNWWVVN
jgi:hypothetical protein